MLALSVPNTSGVGVGVATNVTVGELEVKVPPQNEEGSCVHAPDGAEVGVLAWTMP